MDLYKRIQHCTMQADMRTSWLSQVALFYGRHVCTSTDALCVYPMPMFPVSIPPAGTLQAGCRDFAPGYCCLPIRPVLLRCSRAANMICMLPNLRFFSASLQCPPWLQMQCGTTPAKSWYHCRRLSLPSVSRHRRPCMPALRLPSACPTESGSAMLACFGLQSVQPQQTPKKQFWTVVNEAYYT